MTAVSELVSSSQQTGNDLPAIGRVVPIPSLAEQILEFESVLESVTNSKAHLSTASIPERPESPDSFIELFGVDELISLSSPIKNDVSRINHFKSTGSSSPVNDKTSLLREVLSVSQAPSKSSEEIANSQTQLILNPTAASQDNFGGKTLDNQKSIITLPPTLLTPFMSTASLNKEYQEPLEDISANSKNVLTKSLNLPDKPMKLRYKFSTKLVIGCSPT